ncbi:MAG: shikimate kinase [Planctomycetia bacterium]|nr:shikimate kinase [Planctomycetia bacterium]
MNLILIGYRGTGKSTVARLVARRLGWESLDADVEVELRAGKPIAAIFADEGEAAFRDLESAVLQSLSGRDRLVLAAGGGAVLRPENRRLLKRLGKVVWLKADAQTIQERLSADETTAARRPNLTASGGLAEIVELLERREPLYRETADWKIDTVGRSPGEIAAEIVALTKGQLT